MARKRLRRQTQMGQDLHEEHEEEGEGWLVSYADMVTLLFGLFVILYSMATVEDKKFAELGKSLAAGFNKKAPDITTDAEHDTQNVLTEEQQQMRAFQMLVAIMNLGDPNSAVRDVAKAYQTYVDQKSTGALASEILKDHKEVQVQDAIKNAATHRDERLTEIIIPSNEIFGAGTAKISTQGIRSLEAISKIIIKILDSVTVKIESHTDKTSVSEARPLEGWNLTNDQANAIAYFFLEKGIPGRSISAIGRSYFEPFIPAQQAGVAASAKDQLQNRRVHIILLRK